MTSYLVGSIAFDRIMTFSGYFKEHFIQENINNLSLSFLVDSLDIRRGGTGGNIAYSLGLMKEKPTLIAAVGSDFAEYAKVLEGLGLDLSSLQKCEDLFTATCSLITDKDNNQLVSFYPGAAFHHTAIDLSKADPASDFGIICATNPDDMRIYPGLFAKQGIRYIYDPSQQLPILSGEELLSGIDGAFAFTGNEYELGMICNKTQKSAEELSQLTNCLIITLGEKGSRIVQHGKEDVYIKACEQLTIADPTGAGDAFRAGLLKGLQHKQSIEDCVRLGTVSASFSLECNGPQEHTFDHEAFAKRYLATFGQTCPLSW